MWNPNPALAFATLIVSTCTWVSAQIERVEPFHAVVLEDKTTLHAGDMPQYYAVASLDAGAILLVDGQGGGWSRVSYPEGSTAFVAARDANRSGENSLVITRPTPLKANNLARGFGGSWQNLLAAGQELEPGTTLAFREVVERSDGSVAAYVVSPPAIARTYVETRKLRKATPAEIAALAPTKPAGAAPTDRPSSDPAGSPTNPTTGDANPSAAQSSPTAATPPAGQPAQQPTAQPNAQAPAATDPASSGPASGEEVISLIDEIVEPGSTPPANTPADSPATNTQPVTEIVTDTQGQTGQLNSTIEVLPAGAADAQPTNVPAQPEADSAETRARVEQLQGMINTSLDIEALERSFNTVRTQPLMTAELGELRSQFQRLRDQLGDSPGDQVLASRVDQRLAVLDVMIDLRDRRRELAAQRTAIESTASEVERRIQNAEARATYSIVGQLVPSTIYDGERLPKLYRIVSVDQTGTRTIAYVAENEALELAQKVGRVVGMNGTISIDPTLGVRLVNTSSVSVLQPGG